MGEIQSQCAQQEQKLGIERLVYTREILKWESVRDGSKNRYNCPNRWRLGLTQVTPVVKDCSRFSEWVQYLESNLAEAMGS